MNAARNSSGARTGSMMLLKRAIPSLLLLAHAALQAAPDGIVQLKAVLPTRPVFRGEMFAVDLQIHFLANRDRRIDFNELRNHPPRARTEGIRFLINRPYFSESRGTIGGRPVAIYHYKRAAVATRTGKLELEFNTELLVQDFTGGIPKKIKYELASGPIPLDVRPLPVEGRPAHFTGAVGQFELIVQAEKQRVRVNNPVELMATLQGTGALDTVPMPAPDNGWEGFRVDRLTPRLSVGTIDLEAMTAYSTKQFRVNLLPRRAGTSGIPPLQFSFFNPSTRQYQELTSARLPLVVHGDAPVESTVPESAVNMTAAPESEPEKPYAQWSHPGPLVAPAPPLLTQTWFLAAQSLPMAAWLIALTWRKRRDYYDARPRLVRRLRVEKILRKATPRLEKLALGDNAAEFYAQATGLLRERIGERLDIPAGGITEAVLRDEWSERLPREAAQKLDAFFATANAVRFGAGTRSIPETAPTQLHEILSALDQLEAPVDDV